MISRYGLPIALGFLFFAAVSGFAEGILIVNRTGCSIEIIQAASHGTDQWGEDLISEGIVLDGESVRLDLIGPSPWAFRMIDSSGEVYILYDVFPAPTGKVTVGPEHLARLSEFAGFERRFKLNNRTGATIISLRISSSNDERWGSDVLGGRSIRDGETAEIHLETTPGSLNFDIEFTLLIGNEEIPYEKNSVILTDGASIVLTAAAEDR